MEGVALTAAGGCSQGRSWTMFAVRPEEIHVQLPGAEAAFSCFAFWKSLRFVFQKIAPCSETVIKRENKAGLLNWCHDAAPITMRSRCKMGCWGLEPRGGAAPADFMLLH